MFYKRRKDKEAKADGTPEPKPEKNNGVKLKTPIKVGSVWTEFIFFHPSAVCSLPRPHCFNIGGPIQLYSHHFVLQLLFAFVAQSPQYAYTLPNGHKLFPQGRGKMRFCCIRLAFGPAGFNTRPSLNIPTHLDPTLPLTRAGFHQNQI